jgi:hypothetical protein
LKRLLAQNNYISRKKVKDDEKHVAKRDEEKVVESSSHDTRKTMVSTSNLKDIRNSGSVYVDKTKFLFDLYSNFSRDFFKFW